MVIKHNCLWEQIYLFYDTAPLTNCLAPVLVGKSNAYKLTVIENIIFFNIYNNIILLYVFMQVTIIYILQYI